ncbi:hypothetical protein GTA08_BOTSDO13126 [Botryosphaeria dothidea]|uniref:Uncharacterized protein n=1 Tax=Botryosphaeria dothidea TaxID=55169 RepID=A0A8H4J410_9PEZI|nr:hypothetical protein GTA08_BOTSDO13126 [Botryosphaeria dothidea]
MTVSMKFNLDTECQQQETQAATGERSLACPITGMESGMPCECLANWFGMAVAQRGSLRRAPVDVGCQWAADCVRARPTYPSLPPGFGTSSPGSIRRAGSNQRHHDFRLLTSVDEEQHHLLLAFRLPVDLKVGGRRATRMFFYHISPASLSDANALHYTLEDPSKLQYSLAVSAAKDAGFCAPGRSMRVTLQLSQPGRVLMSKLNADTIQPSTKTSRAVLDQFRSLSTALHIDLYLDSGDGPSMLERLDSICAALEPSKEQPLAYELLIPATSQSVISETSVEREEPDLDAAKQPAPSASRGSKRKRQSSPPPADTPGAAALSAELRDELCALFQTALPSMPSREYTVPRLQPYLRHLGDAARRADTPAFDRAYVCFVALVLLESVFDDGSDKPDVSDDVET